MLATDFVLFIPECFYVRLLLTFNEFRFQCHQMDPVIIFAIIES
jgi:hypothetical protein